MRPRKALAVSDAVIRLALFTTQAVVLRNVRGFPQLKTLPPRYSAKRSTPSVG
jgi:hypothetical protein